MERFAALVRRGRAQLGVDQATLAARVNVGQQAVSRWEQGRGRPRRTTIGALAEVLAIPVDDLLTAAGYVAATADRPEQLSLPVRPLTPTLPFHELSPERFEDVCVEIMQDLFPDGQAARYGGTGEKQHGIDIIVNGPVTAVGQCKRHRNFGPQDVRNAIKAVGIPAERKYLFLARSNATAAARAAIQNAPGWELWDGANLSNRVRSMPRDQALRFVDTHFPNHREMFLGEPQPGPWMTTTEYFATTSGDRILNHDWTLVGRDEEYRALRSAIDDDAQRISLLIGRGGIGKTRLLCAVAKDLDADTWVRFLHPQAVPDPVDYERVPTTGSVLIVLEDAHERTDVGLVVAQIQSRNASAHIAIVARPYGRAVLDYELSRTGIRASALPLVELDDLSQDAAVLLAQEALGTPHSDLADRLAALTYDSPLLTTVGGSLLRTGVIETLRFEQDEEIRAQILGGFRKVMEAQTAHGEPEVRRAVVDAVSILQPVRTADPDFRDALAAIVGVPYHRLAHHLRSLEDAGLLIRRGDALRIAPDLLGDVVLADACVTRSTGVDSGYVSQVLTAAAGDPLLNAFVNVCRVDWQAGHALVDASAQFWRLVQQAVDLRDVDIQLNTIRLVGRVAHFQPARAVAVLRGIAANPIDDRESDDSGSWSHRRKWKHVLEEIPAALQGASYSLDCLPEVCSLLWQLAQTDSRPLNQYPNHPLGVLRELTNYAQYKPVEYHLAILNLAAEWAEDETTISPLAALKGLVATEAESTTYKGHTLYLGSAPLEHSFVDPIRRRAILLALHELRSPDPRRGVAGAEFVRSALHYPPGAFQRPVDYMERHSWDDEFVQTMNSLREVLEGTELDPAVYVAVLEAVHWHSLHGKGSVAAAAKAVVDCLPDTPAYHVALSLHPHWYLLVRDTDEGPVDPLQAMADELGRVCDLVLAAFDAAGAVQLLEERIGQAIRVGDPDRSIPNGLLNMLAVREPGIAWTALSRVTNDPDSPLAVLTDDLVRLLGSLAPADLMRSLTELLDHPSSELRTRAAIGLATRSRVQVPLLDGEADLLHQLAANESEQIRRAVVQAAFSLADTDVRAGARLLGQVRAADSQRVADDVFMYLEWGHSKLTWDSLAEDERAVLFVTLRTVRDIGSPSIGEFLRQRCAETPEPVLRLFQDRVEDAELSGSSKEIQPMPYAWHHALDLRRHPAFIDLLRQTLVWLGSSSSWQRRHYGPEVFAAAAGPFDESIRSLLLDTVRSGDPSTAHAAAHVLAKAPNDLVLDEVNFASDILDAAAAVDPGTLQAVRSALHTSTLTGARWGTPGQPYPEDVRIRDECALIASGLPPRSHAAAFYRDMSEAAARAVEREIADDPPDGRIW